MYIYVYMCVFILIYIYYYYNKTYVLYMTHLVCVRTSLTTLSNLNLQIFRFNIIATTIIFFNHLNNLLVMFVLRMHNSSHSVSILTL